MRKTTVKVGFCAVTAFVIALLFCLLFVEHVPVGYVGVVYTANGVEDNSISQGWHIMSPLRHVKEFPISQQQIVFSNNPEDYNAKKHADWHIDAPANGGMVSINMTVNYNFLPDRVVELYKRFNGMDGTQIVESRVQNSIIAYVKEITPAFSVMDIYADKKPEVNQALTDYLNEKLEGDYGIHISNALIIDVQLDASLQEKIKVKERAKQDAEIAELDRQTAIARAETNKTIAESEAQIKIIEADAEAQVKTIDANAEAEANRVIAESITADLIKMKEAEARLKHGWVTVNGASTVVTTE